MCARCGVCLSGIADCGQFSGAIAPGLREWQPMSAGLPVAGVGAAGSQPMISFVPMGCGLGLAVVRLLCLP
ncbi:MAG: hypothetical protein HC919_15660, partial [Oscillatoriales cyanobacterium SM2_2_1]|nr:hypothetical protein [Oscillatoriales cyanobacterium SM2_2_1]